MLRDSVFLGLCRLGSIELVHFELNNAWMRALRARVAAHDASSRPLVLLSTVEGGLAHSVVAAACVKRDGCNLPAQKLRDLFDRLLEQLGPLVERCGGTRDDLLCKLLTVFHHAVNRDKADGRVQWPQRPLVSLKRKL